MSKYEVQLEVEGPLAMFARPDTGGTPTSYLVPTWSAAKGIFESIAFFVDGAAWVCPTRVEVCRKKRSTSGVGAKHPRGERVRFQRYTTNYGGHLRNKSHMGKGRATEGSSMRLFATALSGVCYRLHGEVVGARRRGPKNPRHHLQELFQRRLARGQCHRTPCLGWSDFTCSYWGPFRSGKTEVDDDLSLDIPSMLVSIWDDPVTASGSRPRYAPRFSQGHRDQAEQTDGPLRIKHGVLDYPVPKDWLGDGVANAQ